MRRTGLRPAYGRKLVYAAVVSCFACETAYANPTGPAVVNGQVNFSRQGSVLNVTNSPGSIINWQSFSIGASETTRFIQQSSASSVLNRVVGQDLSVLLGTLQSNGKVFLINPSGILIGQGARIDVGSFVASTLNITDQNYLAGKLNFGGPGAPAVPGAVRNFGAITTPEGGSVYLIASNVENHGIITSPKGEVMLAAGSSVKLIDTGTPNVYVEITAPDNQALNLGQIVVQSGRIGISAGLIKQQGIIKADSAVLGENGKIVLKGIKGVTLDKASTTTANGPSGGSITIQSDNGTTMVSGKVEATGSDAKGGTIQLLGNQVGLIDQAQVSASGQTGGGTVLVGGDYQGKNPDVQNATATYVGSDVQISADAGESGAGGKVVVWANEATRFFGAISARGGARSGDGGLVETSGKQWLDFRGAVDTSAAHGAMGTLLLDPKSIDANDSGGSAYANPGNALFTDNPSGTSVILASGPGSISAQLSNVLLQANNDITFTSPVNITNPGTTLTAQAGRSILVNADITTNNADVRLTANETTANGVVAAQRDAGAARLSMATGTTINAGTGNITLVMNNGGQPGDSVVENLSAGNINILNINPSSNIALNSNVLATGGITIQALGDVTQSGGTISNAGNGAGTNDVTLSGNNVTLGSVASQRDLFVTASGALSVGNLQAFGAQNFHFDDTFFSYALPFAFSFYGTPYTTAYISSNGVITFGSGTGDFSDSTSSLASYRIVAPAWNDWDTRLPQHDVYITNAVGGLTVRWDVARFPTNTSQLAQFEAMLGQSGNITFNYGPATASFAGDVTIGLSNQSSTSTLVSQLMSQPGFSMNRLNSTTFTYNAGSGSYTEAVSASSNWSSSIPGGPTTAAGVLSALRNATLSAGTSLALARNLTASNNLAFAAGGGVWLSDATVSAGGAVSVGSRSAPVSFFDVTSTSNPASLVAGTSFAANVTNDVTVQGGGASAEIRNTGPGAFSINAGGNVSVTGGSAQGASALIFGNPDVNLTLGGNLYVNGDVTGGSGTYARVQAGSPNSINIAFTNPTGQIVVNNTPFDPAAPGNGTSGLFVGPAGTPVQATAANLHLSGGAVVLPPPTPSTTPTADQAVQSVNNTSIAATTNASNAAAQTIGTALTTDTSGTSTADSEKKDDAKSDQLASSGQSSANKTPKPKPQLCN